MHRCASAMTTMGPLYLHTIDAETLLHSSSTEYSRPILGRAGLTEVASNAT